MALPNIDIVVELEKLYKRGFIRSLREDNTGIGYTLETELGIKENNKGEPDLVYKGLPVELKSQRKNASSRISLITKTPKWNPLTTKEIIHKFGYEDKNKRPALKITITTKEYDRNGFKLEVNKKAGRLNIIQRDYGTIAYFDIKELMDCIKKKLYENLLIVFADRKTIKGEEYFRYEKAILSTHLNDGSFEKLLDEGLIVFEFRMHIEPNEPVRDHGPAFRLGKNHIHELYEKEEVIFDGPKSSEE